MVSKVSASWGRYELNEQNNLIKGDLRKEPVRKRLTCLLEFLLIELSLIL